MTPYPRSRASAIAALIGLVSVSIGCGGRDRPPETRVPPRDYELIRSSGLFSLPEEAVSVDWVLLNNSPRVQRFRVTVYEVPIGESKRVTSPGSIERTLEPDHAFHNANPVRSGGPFQRGFYYEVVVETDSDRVLPSVMTWSNRGNAAVPGTLISPGGFVAIE
jgi:hypothetical protein